MNQLNSSERHNVFQSTGAAYCEVVFQYLPKTGIIKNVEQGAMSPRPKF